MDATKERARRKTSAERATNKRLKAEYAQLKAAQTALPPDPPEDFDSPTVTIYELVQPDGTVISRYLSRRSAHHACLTWNSLLYGDEPKATVRERLLHDATLQAGIFDGDKLVRVEKFVNPLEEFCRMFNESQERIAAAIKLGAKNAPKLRKAKAVRS